ncbi:MAG: ribonuclease D [Alphaproteobacteria bacterium]|nr:ribonuclease D [Alphaproteobacteria bacterium]
MTLIDTTKQLEKACKILKKQKTIAIDCEFIREKTYYPIPCLIQIGYEGGSFLIDPLANDIDFSSFAKLMQDKKILKVFHSGRQDIEIIYNLTGIVPNPVFDTQIAASACGLGESVSYENLVRVYCNVELDKSCRLTNWQLRPLTEEQLEYATGDVTHLLECYEKISAYLTENNRTSWIKEELDDLNDISHYQIEPENSWQRIRHNSHSILFLNVLKALASWREKRAMKQNISRQNVIKDDMLVNIATVFPKNTEELKSVRGIRQDIVKSVLATEMLEVMQAIDVQKLDKTLNKQSKEKDISLAPSQQSLYEILRLLLKIQSNEVGVVPHLISTEKNLREYIKNPKSKNSILSGWRYDVYGKYAELFRQGKLYLSYCQETHKILIKEL